MINGFPINREPALTVVHHDPNTSSGPNLAAEVSLAGFAELAFTALGLIARDNMVSRLNFSYTFTNTLNNPVPRPNKKKIFSIEENLNTPSVLECSHFFNFFLSANVHIYKNN